jgi:hypothetical protein
MTVAVRMFERGPLRLLPVAVREPRRAWLAILVGAALTILGSLLLAGLAGTIAPDLAKPQFPMRGAVAVALLVLFAPLVETLIMAGVLALLARFVMPTVAVVASAALWGVAHSLQAAVWGLVIWWPFLIFSTLYLVWRQHGTMTGIAVAATTHALQNLAPGLAIAYR